MLPYLILFIIILVIAAYASKYQAKGVAVEGPECNSNKTYSNLIMLITIILVCFIGLRYKTGADFGNYTAMYLFRKDRPLSEILFMDNAPINNILIKISKMIYDDTSTFFFIYALITIVLLMHQIKKYNTDIVFSICIFFLSGSVIGPMGAMRQYLAAAILLAGHRYMIDRKFLKYCLIVILASLCHMTALIMLPIYFISNLKIRAKSVAIILAITVVMRYSYDFFFKVMGLSTGEEYSYLTTEVNPLRILVTLAPIALYVVFASRFTYTKSESFYLMTMFLNAAFMISTSQSAYLARIGIYTSIYSVFSYPIILKNFNVRSKLLMKVIIASLYLVYFAFQISTSNLGNYSNILFK